MVCSDHNDRHQPHEMLLQMGRAQRMMMPPATNPSRSPARVPLPPSSASSSSSSASSALGAKAMEHHQQHTAPAAAVGPLRCPRCDSSNTKFCYYNNYSLSQPRHFCKACKRYWTRGGTLRNVPVGGGCRKNKRSKKQPSASAANTTAAVAVQPPPSSADMGSFFLPSSDMNLCSLPFDALGGMAGLISSANPSLLINTNLAHLQQPDEYSSLLASTMKHHQSLSPYDGLHQANIGFLNDVKFEGASNLMTPTASGNFSSWGANNYPFEAINGGGGSAFGDGSCLQYWNPLI